MAKNTKIKKNPEFIVNLTDATSAFDVYAAIAEAKIKKYFTVEELSVLIDLIADRYAQTIPVYMFCADKCPFCEAEEKKEKKNIFTRFWNWITRKK